MLRNLRKVVNGATVPNFSSVYKEVEYLSGKPCSAAIQQELAENGFCLYRDTEMRCMEDLIQNNVGETIFSSLLQPGTNFCHLENLIMMQYAEGIDVRPALGPSILDVTGSTITNNGYMYHHSEMAYADIFPRLVTFICLKNDDFERGYTPMSNLVEITSNMDSMIKNKLLKYGVKYIRELPIIDNSYGKSWQNTLHVETKEDAEFMCNKLGYTFKWLPNGNVF